jgi:mannose/cellobiose epimerase-like protein (N-acyl-D-glucosamine 2-epimerase family)
MNTLLNDDPQIVEAIKARIVSQCLPLWADKGWDSATGSFIERLGADGAPDIAAPRRIRVQARQIYVYAKAAQLGWFPQGREIARKATAYLMDRGRHPDGGYVHLLAPDGAVLDDTRDTYDHAFVLLALANVLRLEDDPRVRSEIEAVVAFLDKSMRGRFGGFVERLPAVLPRRQNPHMHMFEAMIALYEATGDPIYQTRAGDMFSLLARGFFDDQTGTISEYFQENWMPIEPVVIEPGHQAEWLWLLKEFERITGCPTARFRSALMKSALRCVDARTSCLVDECDEEGVITKPGYRLWPQTEIVKAWLVYAEAGDPLAAGEARKALARLDRHFLSHPVAGGWYDHFDGEGHSLVDFIPASSFYHLMCMAAEVDRVLAK